MLLALLAPTALAQVRPLVLESQSHRDVVHSPTLFPARLAKFEPLWEVAAGGTLLPGLVGGPGGVVYGLREGRILSLSPGDGHILWERDAGALQWGPRGMEGRLYVVTPGALAALDPGNGRSLWQQPLGGEAAFPPLLTRDLVVVVLQEGKILALAPEDGSRLWQADLGCALRAEPALDEKMLLAGCPDGTVSALSSIDGQVLWQRMLPAPMVVKPAITEKRVFVGTEDRTVTCLSAGRGKKKYRYRLAGNPASALGVQGDLILAGAQDNLLYGIRQHGGHLAWSADAGARLLTLPAVRGHVAVASPVLSDQLVVMDLRDGAVTGRRFLPGEDRMSAGSPVFAGKTLVAISQPITGGPGWLSGMKLEVTVIQDDTVMGQ